MTGEAFLAAHADFLVPHTRRLLDSFRHWTGRELLADRGDARSDARRLFGAGFVVVSGGAEADQILNYGNAAALRLWEMDWATFTGTPSRLTAEPGHRDERAGLLERVRAHGFIDDYAGVRVSASGRRFRIEEAVVWNLRDETGAYAGQAATFARWTPLG